MGCKAPKETADVSHSLPLGAAIVRRERRQPVTAAVLAVAVFLACASCSGGGGGQATAGPGPGGAAARARLSGPSGLAIDQHGNLYVSEYEGARVVRVAPDGRLTVVAGTGTSGYSGDGGRAVAARLSKPNGLALDAHGALAIADYGNNVIRKVDRSGRITTFLRSEKLGEPIGLAFNSGDLYIADPGDVSVLRVRPSGSFTAVAKDVHPAYLVFDKDGNLDLSDFGHNTILQIAAENILAGREGIASTIAGTGTAGFSGDGGAATEAQVNLPFGIAIDGDGNVYVADTNNNRVRKVDRDGIITTVAGTGARGFGGDGGPATAAKLDAPAGLAIDGNGDLYIADQGNNRVRRVDASGVIATIAGNGAARPRPGRAAAKVKLSAPEGLALDRRGYLYVSEFAGAQVIKIAPDGRFTVVAGTGIPGYSGDGGRATAAQLSEPAGLAFDSRGDLVIADHANGVIRKVNTAGMITTLVGTAARLNKPIGVTFRGSDLYVADPWNARVLRIQASGSATVVATDVHPAYLLLRGARHLDLSDRADSRIKQISLSRTGRHGVVSVIAGTGTAGFSGNGGPAAKAQLNVPYGLAVDARGNLFVADRNNNRVRRIDRHGIITTFAGTGAPGFSGDGGSAKAAKLNSPVGLAIDTAGNLYIADSGNNRVRRVDPHGVITTFVGGGS